jgi:hypothetical protein
MLGGGGQVTVNGPTLTRPVAVYQSYPSAGGTWTIGGIVLGRVGGAATMVVQAYVVCST